MSWLDLPRVDEPEEIDNPNQPLDDLATSMADVARTNTWFGGTRAVVGNVAALLRDVPTEQPVRILDIGTGSADIPRAIVAWGRKNGRSINVVGVDNLRSMLTIAATPHSTFNSQLSTSIHLVQANALALPFRAGSFDIAVCALTLHHVGFDAAVKLLASMDALTTVGFVAADLRRDRLSLAMVSSGLSLIRAHRFTRHDGPASVRRAFTLPEYRKMVALSGVNGIRIRTDWYYRVVLVKEKRLRAIQDSAGSNTDLIMRVF
jgi:2-polyprenyl-3-methyl-5-hydroxy-6-metoxy-1,4-benzoquinol methylase